ncbi:potassium-transporting ATPase subunit KdpC [Phragmitibacter flavus]|uniref:Potassium-transporting ATPase KdpC subunit n=1 Tax=Phragmitibacter flavus TaxID=2576071 RepID=A0A5R8KDC9_9BACT|nr:potassium-transporting ATPase subunit KdpC [Phragmitibacter flavus]TLD70247.1 potassium-transporting ATPase subunit KdpC [Phragmitibacter flavus]
MKTILHHLRASIVITLLFTLILCGLYPLTIWSIGQIAFPHQANGSLITNPQGELLGSTLIGQNFTSPTYFHSRPSAAGPHGYDASSSSGSNLGPTSIKLADQIQQRITDYLSSNTIPPNTPIPADAVTASASGLDPHISPANAELQIPRIARARNLPENQIRQLVHQHTEPPSLGLLAPPRVNVLTLNLALDHQTP